MEPAATGVNWVDWAWRFGLPFTQLAFFVFALHRGWIVMGITHTTITTMLNEALKKETTRADKWESRAEQLLEQAAKAAQASERAVARVSGEEGRQRRGGG